MNCANTILCSPRFYWTGRRNTTIAANTTSGPTPTSVLDKLESRNAITADGNEWIKAALDPFHDFNLNMTGLPDDTTGNSVVRFFKRKLTISRPAGVPVTDNWDCHFFTLPIFDEARFCTRDINGNNGITFSGPGDISATFGTLNIVSGPADGVWFSPTDGIKGSSAIQQLTPDLTLSRRSLARVIGMGFEVHNDTPTLYKGGSVTCYDCPQGDYEPTMVYGPKAWDSPTVEGGDSLMSGPFISLRRPPDNVSQCMQLPNSVTWEAAEGCYVVNKVDIKRSNYTQPNNVPLVFFGQGGAVNQGSPVSKELFTTWEVPGLHNGGSGKYLYGTDPAYRLTSLHTSGAYFNGLPPQTVLTLEVHIIVESLPVNDQAELALASPAAEYDPLALQMYEKSIRTLKSGVPVHMNAKGDWWKMVGGALLNAAPTVASMINPALGTAVGGVIAAGKAAKSAYEKRGAKVAKVQPTSLRKISTDKAVKARLLPIKENKGNTARKKSKNPKGLNIAELNRQIKALENMVIDRI